MVRDTGLNASELSSLMKDRFFGEKKARSLERLLDLPNLWFDGTDAGQDELAREFSTVYANASDRDRSILRATLEAIKGSTIAALRPITEKPAKQD